LKIHFNIIHTSTSGCSKWSLSLKFPPRNPVCTSPVSYTISMASACLCVVCVVCVKYLRLQAKDGSSILQWEVCWVGTAVCALAANVPLDKTTAYNKCMSLFFVLTPLMSFFKYSSLKIEWKWY
jgi:hypothetical protein